MGEGSGVTGRGGVEDDGVYGNTREGMVERVEG